MAELILIVDDEPDIVELLEHGLQQAGYRILTAHDGASALTCVREHLPDLVLLDLMLPDLSGMEVCRRLRREPRTQSTPVVMVTARCEEIDRVVGFELGAEDYITKPFSLRELVLRVQAVLRRTCAPGVARAYMRPLVAEKLVIGALEIDVRQREVRVDNELLPSLTPLEFKLLLELALRRGRVQSRNALLERVWGLSPGTETRTVNTHVRRLRNKLMRAGDYLETVRGVGYRLRAR